MKLPTNYYRRLNVAEENEIEIEVEEVTMVELPEEELEFEDTEDGGAVVKMENM